MESSSTKYPITYDESKELEIIWDFHNTQIWRYNTSDSNAFLASGNEFDAGIAKRLDDQKRCRLMYVCDKVPPLTAILKHLENPFDINWGVFAIILPKDITISDKVDPILRYAIGLTRYRAHFTLGVFKNEHRNHLDEVMEWMDQNMEPKVQDKPNIYFEK